MILENQYAEMELYCKAHKKDIKENGELYLSYAMHPLNENILKLLIDYGANPDYSVNNVTLLEWAIKEHKNEIAVLLMNKGAKFQYDEPHCLLTVSVEYNNLEMLQILKNNGCNLCYIESDKESLLDIAVLNSYFEIINYLLSDEQFVTYIQDNDNELINYILRTWDDEKTPKIVDIVYGDKFNTDNDYSLFCNAIWYLKPNAVAWLINMGCNPFVWSFDEEKIPLDFAYFKEHLMHDYTESNSDDLKKIKQIILLLESKK